MRSKTKEYEKKTEITLFFRDDDQIVKAEEFVSDVIMSIGDDYFNDGVGDMDFTYGSMLYFNAFIYK